MKFSLANADSASFETNGPVKEPTSSSASRSSSASSTKSSKSSSSNAELNTSTTGLCKSSSPVDNMVGSYNFNNNQSDSVEFKKAKPFVMKPYKKCSIASQSPGKFNPKLNSSHDILFKPLSKAPNKIVISKHVESNCSSPKSMSVTPPAPPPPPPPQSPIPPAIPSLASLPSLPASLIASNNLTLISSNSGTLSTNLPSKSSFSNSSSSDKLSSNGKQFASKISSNQICKMERLAKMKSELQPNKNNSNSCSNANSNNANKKSSNANKDNRKNNTKLQVYDHININNKLKEHLYSPLNFENGRTANGSSANGRESKMSSVSSLSKKKREAKRLQNDKIEHDKTGLAIADSFDLIEKKLANSGMTMKKTKVIRRSEKRRSKLVFVDSQVLNNETVKQIESKEVLEIVTKNTINLNENKTKSNESELNETNNEEYSYAQSHKSITTKSEDKWDYNENEYDSNREEENDQDADNEYEDDYIYDEEGGEENEYNEDEHDDNDDDDDEEDEEDDEDAEEDENAQDNENEYDECEKNCNCSKSNYGEEYDYEYNYEEEQNETNKNEQGESTDNKLKCDCAPEIENEYDVVDVDENFDDKQNETAINSIEITRDIITPLPDTPKELDQTTRLDMQEDIDTANKSNENEKKQESLEQEIKQLNLVENKGDSEEDEDQNSSKIKSGHEKKIEEVYDENLNEKSCSLVNNSNLESSITCTSF